LLKLISAVFVNPDMLTGFRTLWEIEYRKNYMYTLLVKRGHVHGYSALMSYVPDLKLGTHTEMYKLNQELMSRPKGSERLISSWFNV